MTAITMVLRVNDFRSIECVITSRLTEADRGSVSKQFRLLVGITL